MRLPSFERAQTILLTLWLSCFAAVMLTVGVTYGLGWIGSATAISSAEKLSKLYAPYVGGLVAYSFAVRKKKKKQVDHGTVGAAVALAGTLLWNLPVVLLITRHLIPAPCEPGQNCMEDTVPVVAAWGEYCSIVVGPALGFYFGVHN
jgi:hypothetical protein